MKNIENCLAEIISKRSGRHMDEVLSLKEESLLGPKFRMPARELFHVYFDVENAFGITIPETSIKEGKFKSPQDILEIIKNASLAPVGEENG